MKLNKISALLAFLSISTLPASAIYIGASAGYFFDADDEFFAVRIGVPGSESGRFSHNFELEALTLSFSDADLSKRLRPITANYRGVFNLNESLGIYAGLGLGLANVQASRDGERQSDVTFSGQAFAGALFNVTSDIQVGAGLRYINADSVKLFGVDERVGDDIAVELTAGYRF